MDLKRPTIKLNILVLRRTNENIVVFGNLTKLSDCFREFENYFGTWCIDASMKKL